MSAPPPAQATVLLAEHEPQICAALSESLRAAGCRVLVAVNGREALESTRREKPDLVVLDWTLPLIDGRAVCRKLRDNSSTATLPIVLLTGLCNGSSSFQRIEAFETGADDSLTKPCSLREFVLRVEAVLRRTRWAAEGGRNVQEFCGEKLLVMLGPLRMDRLRRVATLDGQLLTLTPKEYHLLDLLACARGLPVSCGHLLREVWNLSGPASQTRTLATHVARLRRKMGCHAAMIPTHHRGTYRLSVLTTAEPADTPHLAAA